MSDAAGNISIRIKEVRGDATQVEFSAKIGVDKNLVGKWERGESLPSGASLVRIRDVTGINIDWLLTGEGDMYGTRHDAAWGIHTPGIPGIPETAEPFLPATAIPSYDAFASGGAGAFNDKEVVEYIKFPRDVLDTLSFSKFDNLAILNAIGDSMQPTIHAGDRLLIDTLDIDAQAIQGNGVYVLAVDDVLLVKRLQRKVTGAILVISDNPLYAPEEIDKATARTLHIIGKVIWVGHKMP